ATLRPRGEHLPKFRSVAGCLPPRAGATLLIEPRETNGVPLGGKPWSASGGASSSRSLAARRRGRSALMHKRLSGRQSGSSPRAFAPLTAAYYQGIRELGFVEGQNIVAIYAWAEGDYGKLDALANDLVRRQVKLIVASGGLVSARAAMKATATIPIVFISGL